MVVLDALNGEILFVVALTTTPLGRLVHSVSDQIIERVLL